MQTEKTLLSAVVDMDTNDSFFNQPCVTIRFNEANAERPLHFIVRHSWTTNQHNYPINKKFKTLLNTNPTELVLMALNDLLPQYEGNKKVSELYISPAAKEL